MSEISNHSPNRVKHLVELVAGLLEKQNGRALYEKYVDDIEKVSPLEVVLLFHEVMKLSYPIEEIKTAVNKSLNLMFKAIDSYPSIEPEPASYLGTLKQNNARMEDLLNRLKPLVRNINDAPGDVTSKEKAAKIVEELLQFRQHYVQKENLLFPLIEQEMPEHKCLQIMWSFHDDIVRNLKSLRELLTGGDFDKNRFNRLCGDIFFNMLAIKFREEKILFPVMLQKIGSEKFDLLIPESMELGWPYIPPSNPEVIKPSASANNGKIDLDTGALTPEQIMLLFNHLPVDITFVDENDEVRYFSTPPKRVFPRTKAVIGRKVQNCHPPESIDVVNKIVASFKSGEKSNADFWINMKGEMILIRYFAVRDAEGNYRGTVEVTEEIGDIQKLEGQKRLLDW